ncbi:MATE family efflux transporter [Enterococcus diestrammenae]|uniref:MATE family efflux transporter n=1 Tax=Enterococcus diestrammenae TaxID=1155073 RepID=UPI001958C394
MENNKRKIYRELNAFAAPLVLKNLLQVLIELGLGMISGHISLAAIAATGTIDGLLYALIGFLGSGTVSYTIYAARIVDKQSREAKELFKSLVGLNGALGIGCTVILLLFAREIMAGIYHFDGQLLALTVDYCRVSSWNVLLTLLSFALTNQMKVRKQTQGILQASFFGGLGQLALTGLFAGLVFTGENRVLGVALGGVLSEVFVFMYYAWLLRQDLGQLKGVSACRWTFLLRKSGVLFLQELVEGSLFQVLVTAALARTGSLLFAAYQICLRLTEVFLAPLFMYCNGLMVLLGEKLGLGERESLRQLPRITLQMVLSLFFAMALPGWLFREQLLGLITNLPAVSAKGGSLLGLVILTEASRPFYEISKYSLQTVGGEKQALKITGVINSGALLAIWLMPTRLPLILLSVMASQLLCAGSFYFEFRKACADLFPVKVQLDK